MVGNVLLEKIKFIESKKEHNFVDVLWPVVVLELFNKLKNPMGGAGTIGTLPVHLSSSLVFSTSGAGTVYPSGATLVFSGAGITQSLVFCVVFCR